MLIAFIALSLVPVIIVGIVGIVSNVNSLRQIAIKNLRYDLAERQQNLDLFFNSIEENVNSLVSSVTFDRFINAIKSNNQVNINQTTADLLPEILNFTRNRDFFYQIKFIDNNGDEQFLVQNIDSTYQLLERNELNKSPTGFYSYIAKRIAPNTATFIPIELKKGIGNELIPAISCIFNVSKPDFFGILVLQIYAKNFIKFIERENPRIQDAKLMLVNNEGYYIYHSSKKNEWNQLSASKLTLNLRTDFGNRNADKILSDSDNVIYDFGDQIVAQTKVFTSDFSLDNENTLILSVKKDDIFKTVNYYKLIIYILFVFFLLVALLLALLATQQFIKPIRLLIGEARIIASGNYDVRVKIDTKDEIEELANQFNIMASSLQQREILINQHKDLLEQKVKDRTEDLENEKNKLKTIFDNVPIGFILLDMENKIISASFEIERILGKQIEEIAGKDYFEITKWENDDKKELIEKIKLTKETFTDYTSIINKDGSKQFLEHILIPIKNNNKIESILEITIDITERKRLQDLLIHSERLAASGELAAVIAHEIRNSLTSVRMILQLLSRKEGNLKFDVDSFHVALDSVYRMERVVNDLLQLARPSKLERKYENINNVLESGVEHYISHMQQLNIETEMNLENDLPKILIDKNRIKEVFINLILNAIQAFNGSGKIIISTKFIILDKTIREMSKVKIVDSGYHQVDIEEILLKKGSKVIELKIRDTGQGINSNIIGRIFDPFFTTKVKGTGLGLSLVKDAINKHGGIIQVQSKVQKGSIFTIFLPVK